jgi:SAM-dependent methyltransferase
MSATVEAFWTKHQVGGPYDTVEASMEALNDRAELFPELDELMPTDAEDLTVLDYGCGPGHDTILFLNGGARHVYYADISAQAIATTARRLALHGYPSAFASPQIVQDHGPLRLPMADRVHCAGVLHHTTYPYDVLVALRRAINPGGDLRLMVYSGDTSPHTQSAVPVTRWWTREQMFEMADQAGLAAEYVGSYPCPAPWRPDCVADCYRMVPA